MSFGRIKLRKPDILFSRYLRLTRKRCEKCGRRGEGKDEIDKLQCSHFWGRKNENVRYSEKNCACLCFSCHQYFEQNPSEYTEWMLKKLGKKEFAKLKLAAHFYCKRDDLANEIYWKQKLKDYEKTTI